MKSPKFSIQPCWVLGFTLFSHLAMALEPASVASIAPEDLVEFETQSAPMQALIRNALKLTEKKLTYQFGSNSPSNAGMDCSGSMIGKPMKVGSLFASVLYKVNDADLMLFSGDARYVPFNADDGTLSLAQRIEEKAEWSGTNFHSVFQRANRAYDRVVILSDMQAWIGNWTPKAAFDRYVQKVGQRPRIYSFDIAGYGTLQFPEREVYALAGFSDKTLETMRFLEEDKNALLKKIESIDL